MKRAPLLLLLLCLLLVGDRSLAATDAENALIAERQQKVSDILDKWTVLRWGTDNLAWLVHYPEELVEPYVQLEAVRRKLKPKQVDEYRKAFRDELRIGAATGFMLSVHVFGREPVRLAPISETVLLVDASGRGIKPISYEKKLDLPMIGLVQGFVFFKKQESQNLKVLVKGLIPGAMTPFVFQRGGGTPSEIIGELPIKTGGPAPVKTRKNRPQQNKNPEVLIKIPVVTAPIKPVPVSPPSKPQENTEEGAPVSEDLPTEPEAKMYPAPSRRSA